MENILSDKKEAPILGLVVPCYNEEAVLLETSKRIIASLNKFLAEDVIKESSFVLFVDDGSIDQTWKIISNLKKEHPTLIRGIALAHNVGHQNALLAGLMIAKDAADCVISLDADLQDDVDILKNFIDKFLEGKDVVYGVRKNRKSDSLLKKTTAILFYKIMKLMGVDIVYNHADYRLVSKRVLEGLSQFGEVNLFLRGIFPLIGFSSANVYYDRKERVAGKTKYPIKKMISFALDGITSFSVRPLRLVSFLGFFIFFASIILGGYVLFEKLLTSKTVPGWASTVLPIYFLGGIQILTLGIIGEYIGKIYKETKDRPRYIIKEKLL